MPGPKSSPQAGFRFPIGNPNARAAKRLEKRKNAAPQVRGFRQPGSQNRKK